MAVDPDEIFKLHQKTCPLNEVFSDKSELLLSQMPHPHDSRVLCIRVCAVLNWTLYWES